MAKARWGSVLRRVHTLLDEGAVGAVSDGILLERYANGGRESAERAFAALVDRHGPMVLRVCRSVLREEHAAHDAFQATFLVLARRASSLWVHESIAPWLYQVAVRTSSAARNAATRRRLHERKASERTRPDVETMEADERGPILHQEIDRLPERYRAAIVLCYLEGLTHEQAAERLGCPVGTVRSRLATGRERLRRRLLLRGVAPGPDVLEPTSAGESAPVVPAALAASTIRISMVHSGATAAGAVPVAVAALAREELRIMSIARLRNWTLGLLLMAAGGGSVGVLALAQRPEEPGQSDRPQAQAALRGPMARTVRLLLEARVETAREVLNRDIEGLRTRGDGVPDVFDRIPVWSRRLMDDRLRLAATPAQRVEAIREHRDRMIVLEHAMGAYAASGRGRSSDGLKGKYYRLEAHQFLAEEGVDPEKERPNVDPEKELGPHPHPTTPVPHGRR